jgi:predicted secreted protein
MKLQSILAIYALFWTMSLFLVLPFGVRTPEEAGVERPAGHAESAPHSFSFARAAVRATVVSALLFGLFYLNYLYGWVRVESLEWARPPAG